MTNVEAIKTALNQTLCSGLVVPDYGTIPYWPNGSRTDTYPRFTIGSITDIEAGTKTCEGGEMTVTFDIYTKSRYDLPCYRAIDALRSILDHETYATSPATSGVLSDGYESGTFGSWTAQIPNVPFKNEVVATRAHTGTYSARHYMHPATIWPIWRMIATEPGDTYTLSAWVYVVSGALFVNGIADIGIGPSGALDHATSRSSGAWEQLSASHVATGTEVMLSLAGSADAYYDDITVTRTSAVPWVSGIYGARVEYSQVVWEKSDLAHGVLRVRFTSLYT